MRAADQITPITGRDVATAAALDFASFFLIGHEVAVDVTYGPVIAPCVRSDRGGTRIVLPREMGDDLIDTPERLLFHLLMIGHEIAHLVHGHVETTSDQSDEDFHCLEFWADFYGAKVMMTLLTHGPVTSTYTKRFWPSGNLSDALERIGDAIGLLFGTVYRDHRRYPKKLDRVGLTANGVMSFLRHYYGRNLDARLYFSVYLRVLSAPNVQEAIQRGDGADPFSPAPFERAWRWHRAAQGDATALAPGLRLEFLDYLHTTFDQTKEELEESQRLRLRELQSVGLLPTDLHADNEKSPPHSERQDD